jgi:hypothetical protein
LLIRTVGSLEGLEILNIIAATKELTGTRQMLAKSTQKARQVSTVSDSCILRRMTSHHFSKTNKIVKEKTYEYTDFWSAGCKIEGIDRFGTQQIRK